VHFLFEDVSNMDISRLVKIGGISLDTGACRQA
jgi:hypothetical protein